MRELILKMSVSVDGFVAGADGSINWVFGADPEAVAWTVATISDSSLHIMGSRTFQDMAAYWPTSTQVFAAPMNQIPKAVFSRKGLKQAGTTAALAQARANAGTEAQATQQPGAESWSQAYVASGDLATEVEGLKAGTGAPIVAHGGASFARSLIASGCIDQYSLLVHPVVLGAGLAIFSGVTAPRFLTLVRSIAFPGGCVAQIYRPTKPS
jgi:dihydrofolate reductase